MLLPPWFLDFPTRLVASQTLLFEHVPNPNRFTVPQLMLLAYLFWVILPEIREWGCCVRLLLFNANDDETVSPINFFSISYNSSPCHTHPLQRFYLRTLTVFLWIIAIRHSFSPCLGSHLSGIHAPYWWGTATADCWAAHVILSFQCFIFSLAPTVFRIKLISKALSFHGFGYCWLLENAEISNAPVSSNDGSI